MEKKVKDPTSTGPHKIDARRWRHTEPVKLKDKTGRGGVFYNLKAVFGFFPEWIAITKVKGDHDKFILSAEVPDAEWAKMQANTVKPAGKKSDKSPLETNT